MACLGIDYQATAPHTIYLCYNQHMCILLPQEVP
jgi:hypothetical protein